MGEGAPWNPFEFGPSFCAKVRLAFFFSFFRPGIFVAQLFAMIILLWIVLAALFGPTVNALERETIGDRARRLRNRSRSEKFASNYFPKNETSLKFESNSTHRKFSPSMISSIVLST